MSSSKRVVLTMQQRLDILEDLKTFSIASAAKKHKVHYTTIRRILERAPEILKFAEKDKKEKRRQKIRKPLYEELEQQLLIWYTERRATGNFVSDALFLEKAVELKEQIGTSTHFKASAGWLAKFKRRHGIRLVHVYGEQASADKNAANKFISYFRKFLNEQNIDLDNVYNMDDSKLLWKALPAKIFVGKNEMCASGQKMRNERITVRFCTNVTGMHKMMPLVINKYKNPRTLQNIELPIIFKNEPNAQTDPSLFVDWFENYFKKAVRTFQLQKGLHGKIVLLIDNCSNYIFPPTYTHDDYFQIIYLPPNTKALIQPMVQGIIEKTKRCFRHKLMQYVIRNENGIQDFDKKYTIKDCIKIINDAWNEITQNDIKNAWKKIIAPHQMEIEIAAEEEEKGDIISEMRQICTHFSEQNITIKDIVDYLSTCTAEENTYSKNDEETIEERSQDEHESMEIEINEHIKQERDKEHNEEGDEHEERFHEVEFTQEERKRIENAFECLEEFKNRYSLSTQFILKGLKLSILGNVQQ
nr:PREDICTED: jerky protein homolog-like [Megachile rotundata]XP_012150438.1 PREDICTED: jerky protein homolog-like [Megachile rotundata]XP_012150439.1 PREDICTED: jerky protein homolog-like [Megachile rotundata]XP_012150440.1 PREDICTED: jerky protein homolog-like [Megachile rotundata]